MKLLFVGGGSLGPVTPLLAVARTLRKHREIKCVWVGTPEGPEVSLIKAEKIPFFTLTSVKWPRYFSLGWFTLPFRWFAVRRSARRLVRDLRPDGVVSMGGFTALPVIRAAARAGIPCFTHQLDYQPGLTNRLLARACISVTTSFEYQERPFGERVCDEPIPTPVRFSLKDVPSRETAAHALGLNPRRPIVFIYGGGQGAQALNEHVARRLDAWLTFAQVIHVTGLGKAPAARKKRAGYVTRPLLNSEEMLQAHALADIEILRGGIGSLSEVAALKKAAFVVPMPDSHQEANAHAFEEQGAALVFDQRSPTFDDDLVSSAQLLLDDAKERGEMGERANAFFPTDVGLALAERILHHYHERHL